MLAYRTYSLLNVHFFLPTLLHLSLLKKNQRDLSSLKKQKKKIFLYGMILAFALTDHESGNPKGKVCHLLQSSLNMTVGGTAFLKTTVYMIYYALKSVHLFKVHTSNTFGK